MSVEYVFFICLFCLAVGWFWANWRNQKAGETADAVGWANRRSPLIYETTDSSNSTRLETIAQYERALEMLALHGNQWLGRNDEERRQNVHLWVWGADAENTCTDFEMWKFLNVARRAQVHEAFNKQKAQNFARFYKEADGARVFAEDFVKDENGQY